MKTSLEPFEMMMIVNIITALPTMITKSISWESCEKVSLVFSNVPGPKQPLSFSGGLKAKKMMFFAPGLGKLSSCISVISHANIIKVGCLSDKACIEKPKQLMQLFNKNFDAILKSLKTKTPCLSEASTSAEKP